MTLVLDLRIAHARWGSNTDPNLKGYLHYPNDLDKPLSEVADKIRKYRTDYNNNPPNDISFMSTIVSTSGRLHSEFVRILFLQAHRETDRFFGASGVQIEQHDRGGLHYRHTTLSRQLKRKTVSILATCMKFIFHYTREAYSEIELEID